MGDLGYWLPLWAKQLPGWLQAILIMAAVVAALSVIWRQAIKPILVGTRELASSIHKIATLMENEPILTDIVEAFRPNGGTSLPQTVTRIDHTVDGIAKSVNEIIENAKAVDVRVDHIDRELEKHIGWSKDRNDELQKIREHYNPPTTPRVSRPRKAQS